MSEEMKAALEAEPAEDSGIIIEEDQETLEAESAPAQVEEEVNTGTSDDLPAEPDGVQKRINKITADKYAEKRRADELASKLAELQSNQSAEVKRPTLEDFDFDEGAYTEALIDFKVGQRLAEKESLKQQESIQEEVEKVQSSFNSRVEGFVKSAPDYQEVVQALPELPGDVFETIMLAEDGPKLAYYLGKHLDVVDNLMSLPSNLRVMKLGEISAGLKAVNKTVKPSAAPDPIKPLTTAGAVAAERGPKGATFE